MHNSIGVVTALNPIIGYKNSTKIAKEALEPGRSVYELVLEHGILNKEELDTILSPENMLKPVKLDPHRGRGKRRGTGRNSVCHGRSKRTDHRSAGTLQCPVVR